MKGYQRALLTMLCLILNAQVLADDPPQPLCRSTIDCLPLIAQYLQNLGANFGVPATPPAITNQFLQLENMQGAQNNLIKTQLGALTITTANNEGTSVSYNIVSGAPQQYDYLNSLLNVTYAYTSNKASTSSLALPTVQTPMQNTKKDQKPYQVDPVSQTIVNMLTTPPNPSNCSSGSSTGITASASTCVTAPAILASVVSLPTPLSNYYNPKDNNIETLIPQLNENTLITPLLIAPTSAGGQAGEVTAEQANDFIRYASGTIVPPVLPDFNLINQSFSGNSPDQVAAISNYIASFRTYLAQISVGMSNLYYLLSKRLPQTDYQGNKTSQALNEYTMATWRLYDPNKPGTPGPTQWLDQINTASSATIQKEMVTLLAEINYQLYLNRQQQERLLATNSVLLLMSAKAGMPDTSALTNALSPNSSKPASTDTKSDSGLLK